MRSLLFSLPVVALLATACAPLAQPTLPAATPTSIPATDTPAPPTNTPEPTGGPIRVDLTPAQLAALNSLTEALNVPADQVKLISTEAVEWPDHCLGIRRIGVLCAQGIVPGFRIILEANGQTYEYHTNQDGSVIAPNLAMQSSDASVQAAIQALMAALGLTEQDIQVVSTAPIEWPDGCLGIVQPGMACIQVITPGWLIVLEAQGRQFEYHANADGSLVLSATLALRWHREGGIAGFCDDLLVYWSGEAIPQACKLKIAYPEGQLSEAELKQLDDWAARFGDVAIDLRDNPAPADAMTITLSFSGRGQEQPSEAEQQAMVTWAQAVFTRLTQ